jgi:hypothetical protein
MARKAKGDYRDERRLDHDRADRQEPNLVFCLTVHQILTLEAMDRSRPIGAPWNSPPRPALPSRASVYCRERRQPARPRLRPFWRGRAACGTRRQVGRFLFWCSLLQARRLACAAAGPSAPNPAGGRCAAPGERR